MKTARDFGVLKESDGEIRKCGAGNLETGMQEGAVREAGGERWEILALSAKRAEK